MHKERMKELRRMLNQHDSIFSGLEFSINFWFIIQSLHRKPEKDDRCRIKSTKKNTCGSAACALGSAALHKPFMEEGLRLISSEGIITPYYKGYGDYDAGQKFFDIPSNQARWLFSPNQYRAYRPTARQVAKRVSYLINNPNHDLYLNEYKMQRYPRR